MKDEKRMNEDELRKENEERLISNMWGNNPLIFQKSKDYRVNIRFMSNLPIKATDNGKCVLYLYPVYDLDNKVLKHWYLSCQQTFEELGEFGKIEGREFSVQAIHGDNEVYFDIQEINYDKRGK